jgi:hypothetical protein
MIAVDSFDLFTMLLRVPSIGNRLCEQYPQLIAKEKFMTAIDIDNIIRTYLNGKLHSFNDQPAVEFANGYKFWYWNGKRHRRELPAIECATSGIKEWYKRGKFIK